MKLLTTIALLWALLLGAAPATGQWAQAPEIKSLYEAAKAEGEVIVWAAQQRSVSWIPRAFSQMFPGIAVKAYAAADIADRAMVDARSNQFGVDALWLGVAAAVPVMRRDQVALLDWSLFGVAPGNLAFDGRMALASNLVFVIGYYAPAVTESQLPATWEDLLDDAFQSRMVGSLYQLPELIAGLSQEWGNDRALAFARDLVVRGRLQVTRAPREAILKAGERPFAIGEFDTLTRLWTADGLPYGYKPLEPVVARQFGAMVMNAAAHPNAARLLAGWLVSREGKLARERAIGELDYRPGTENETARRLLARGTRFIYETADKAGDREALVARLTTMLTPPPR